MHAPIEIEDALLEARHRRVAVVVDIIADGQAHAVRLPGRGVDDALSWLERDRVVLDTSRRTLRSMRRHIQGALCVERVCHKYVRGEGHTHLRRVGVDLGIRVLELATLATPRPRAIIGAADVVRRAAVAADGAGVGLLCEGGDQGRVLIVVVVVVCQRAHSGRGAHLGAQKGARMWSDGGRGAYLSMGACAMTTYSQTNTPAHVLITWMN